jgi:hypothetical protein
MQQQLYLLIKIRVIFAGSLAIPFLSVCWYKGLKGPENYNLSLVEPLFPLLEMFFS